MPKTKRWHFHPPAPDSMQTIFPSTHPALRQLLYNRGITNREQARKFLRPTLDHLHDPLQLTDMKKAVKRIQQAVEKNEKILVYGDYDADGICSTTLLFSTLKRFHHNTSYFIPDRFADGYGLSKKTIDQVHQQEQPQLIITVDCGITNKQEVEYANSLGLEMIVTDHHHVPDKLPPALAVIDPKRGDGNYPFTELAGVGVAYKLCQALQQTFDFEYQYDPLELVAFATIADVVSLVDENRALTKFGLQAIRKTERPGLIALMENASVTQATLESYHIGFQLAPRLNAAGRLKHAKLGVELLLAESLEIARPLAAELGRLNSLRQQMTQQVVDACREQVEPQLEHKILILGGKDWSSGVVGLAAGRICEEFHRPTIVMELGEETSRASARSIPGFHLTKALNSMGELFLSHGGHAEAAGFSIANENIAEFKKRLVEFADAHITEEDLQPIMNIDAELDLENIDYKLFRAIEYLAPFGHSNPEPVFAAKNRSGHQTKRIGKDRTHLRLQLPTNHGNQLTGVGFGFGDYHEKLKQSDEMHLAYHLNENEWQGNRSLQLMLRDIKTEETGIHHQPDLMKREPIFASG